MVRVRVRVCVCVCVCTALYGTAPPHSMNVCGFSRPIVQQARLSGIVVL